MCYFNSGAARVRWYSPQLKKKKKKKGNLNPKSQTLMITTKVL